MIEYKNINNLAKINLEQKKLKKEILLKELEIIDGYEIVKDFYSPKNIAYSGIATVFNAVPIEKLILGAIKFVRNKIK